MRILHLLDPAACGDEGILCCAAAMSITSAEDVYIRHDCWLIGDSGAERRAWELGIATVDRISPRAGSAPALRGFGRIRDRRGGERPDIVQCWSMRSAATARRVFGSGSASPARTVLIPRPPLNATHAPASDSDLATGREVYITLDAATRATIAPLISRAGPREAARWLPTIRLVETPAFSPSAQPDAFPRRAEIRAALGLEPAEIVIGLLADPPSAADAQRAVFTAGVLLAAGHTSTWFLRRGIRQDRRGAEYTRAQGHRWGLAIADLSLPELIAASDICFVDAVPDPTGSPIATCGPAAIALALASGVPVVAAPGPPLLQLAQGDPAPITIAPSPAPGRSAVPIAAILKSAATRTALAAAARDWCARARARNDFATTLAAIWLEAANIPSFTAPAAALR